MSTPDFFFFLCVYVWLLSHGENDTEPALWMLCYFFFHCVIKYSTRSNSRQEVLCWLTVGGVRSFMAVVGKAWQEREAAGHICLSNQKAEKDRK